MHGGDEYREYTPTSISPSTPLPFPFDNSEYYVDSARELSFTKDPDTEANSVFVVVEPNSQRKFLLEFVDDGIRVYQEDTKRDVSPSSVYPWSGGV
jgi:hypothetical protein